MVNNEIKYKSPIFQEETSEKTHNLQEDDLIIDEIDENVSSSETDSIEKNVSNSELANFEEEVSNIEKEKTVETNCLALTVRKDYNLSIFKNGIIKTFRTTCKITICTILLNILNLFF